MMTIITKVGREKKLKVNKKVQALMKKVNGIDRNVKYWMITRFLERCHCQHKLVFYDYRKETKRTYSEEDGDFYHR